MSAAAPKGAKPAILAKLAAGPQTDAELASALGLGHTHVNQTCRALEKEGWVIRKPGPAGQIVNVSVPAGQQVSSLLREDRLKEILAAHLRSLGYQVVVMMGTKPGIDMDARRPGERLIVEAKGEAALNAQQVNYFLHAIGELVLRMSDRSARYALALPDNAQYRGLINRIPQPVWEALNLSIFLVEATGSVTELHGPLSSAPAA